jgi:hypothetical protein
MPTLVELKKLLGADGKPVCLPSGGFICTPCKRGCCQPPPCLRVTTNFWIPPFNGNDEFTCPHSEDPSDTYYPCFQAYSDMQYGGSAGRNIGFDVLVPFVGAGGPSPSEPFEYYLEWEVNQPTIYTPGDMAAFGHHPNSYFVGCQGASNFYVMRISVLIYCEPNPADPNGVGWYTLDIQYKLRRMTDGVISATNDADARLLLRSRFNYGPVPRCSPVSWEQTGQDDAGNEGFNCSDNGAGRLAQRSGQGFFNPYCLITNGPEVGASRRLELTWPCFKDMPVEVKTWDCGATLPSPPVGVGQPPQPPPTPTPPPEDVACCEGLFPFGNDPYLVITGSMFGVGNPGFPVFAPGCDTCLNGPIFFYFYRTPTEKGFLATASACGSVLTIRMRCPDDDVEWFTTAEMTMPDGSSVLIITNLVVPPCTSGHAATYFELALGMNPGTNCFMGCPCYGGTYIIAG